jgi:hypothetical protein
MFSVPRYISRALKLPGPLSLPVNHFRNRREEANYIYKSLRMPSVLASFIPPLEFWSIQRASLLSKVTPAKLLLFLHSIVTLTTSTHPDHPL